VDDAVRGLLAAGAASDVEGSTVDLGSGTLVPIRAVVEELVRLVGVPVAPQFGVLPDRPRERVRAAAVEEAFARLGWRPDISLTRGLERTVAWYREQPGEVPPPAGPTAGEPRRGETR